MAAPYSLRTFVWKASLGDLEELLRRMGYKKSFELLGTESNVRQSIFTYIAELTSDERSQIEAEFQDIFGIASDRGIEAAIRIATRTREFHGTREEFRIFLASMASDLDRAFWIYLNLPKCWLAILQIVEIEAIAPSYWHKHSRIPRSQSDFSRSALASLAGAIGRYFHVIEGRGPNCEVDLLQEGDIVYLLCMLEDRSRAEPAWEGKTVVRKPSRRAVPLIFAFSEVDGKLDTYLRGNSKAAIACQAIFAEHILHLKKLDPPPRDLGVYLLDGFKCRGFMYVFGAESGLEAVSVRKIRLTPKLAAKRHLLVEGNPSGRNEPVYDFLEKELKKLDLAQYDVTHVELKAVFGATLGKRRQTIPISITSPNRCSLRYDGRHLILRKMLVDSGIEPHYPTD